jgi:acetolactate synthase-1/2/3 large subunit
MSHSAGHLIVDTLENAGIERVYAVPGESYLDVLDGLYDSSVETIVCRQEGGAGFMALTEARLTGRPGIAMVTRGPGRCERDDRHPHRMAGCDRTRPLRRPRPDSPTEPASPSRSSVCPSGSPRRPNVSSPSTTSTAPVNSPPMPCASPRPVGPDPSSSACPKTSSSASPRLDRPRPSPRRPHRQPATAETRIAERPASPQPKRPAFVLGGDGWHSGCGADLAGVRRLGRGFLSSATGGPTMRVPHMTAPAWAGWLGYGRADAVAGRFRRGRPARSSSAAPAQMWPATGTRSGSMLKPCSCPSTPEATQHAGRIDQQILASPQYLHRGADQASMPMRCVRGERSDEWMRRTARRCSPASPPIGPTPRRRH